MQLPITFLIAALFFYTSPSTKLPVYNQISTPFYYAEDFEDGAGFWTAYGANSSWEYGTPADSTIQNAASGSKAWVTDLTSNYNVDEVSFLESPILDFSSLVSDPLLQFSLYYQIEDGFDGCFVETSIDGGVTWQKLTRGSSQIDINWYNDTSSDWWTGDSGNWITATNLLHNTAQQPDVRVRFAFFSDPIITQAGMAIDDIVIEELPTDDIGVFSIVSPISGCSSPTDELISISLQNFGTNSQSNFLVSCTVGGTVLNEIFTGTLSSLTRQQFTFTQRIDLSNPGNYTISCSTQLMNDADLSNDHQSVQIRKEATISSFPYIENFETFSKCGANFQCAFDCSQAIGNDWTQDDRDDDDWRIHAGSTPSSPSTGPEIDYNPGTGQGRYLYIEASGQCLNQTSILISPCFDLSNLSNPVVDFYIHRFGADMGSLAVDVNKLNSSAGGSDWTHVFSTSGSLQTSPGDFWERVSIDLSDFTHSPIKLRWRGTTGNGFNSDLALDHIRVGNAVSCVEPNFIEISQITSQSAKVTWTSFNSNTQFSEIEYGLVGFTPGTGTAIQEPSDTAYIIDLEPGTEYEVYVRDRCAQGVFSQYSQSIRFFTECDVFDGDDFQHPIVVNDLPYVHINSTELCYSNQNLTREGRDVFYKFHTTPCAQTLRISTCSPHTSFDTHIFLLDSLGNVLASNDDAIPGTCSSDLNGFNRKSILIWPIENDSMSTYYVVIDGFNTEAYGTFQMEIEEIAGLVLTGNVTPEDQLSFFSHGSIISNRKHTDFLLMGREISYLAGTEIVLRPGFELIEGISFIGEIHGLPCND